MTYFSFLPSVSRHTLYVALPTTTFSLHVAWTLYVMHCHIPTYSISFIPTHIPIILQAFLPYVIHTSLYCFMSIFKFHWFKRLYLTTLESTTRTVRVGMNDLHPHTYQHTFAHPHTDTQTHTLTGTLVYMARATDTMYVHTVLYIIAFTGLYHIQVALFGISLKYLV